MQQLTTQMIEQKNRFYTLKAVAKDAPRHDLVCFVGDFNLKLGARSPTILKFSAVKALANLARIFHC